MRIKSRLFRKFQLSNLKTLLLTDTAEPLQPDPGLWTLAAAVCCECFCLNHSQKPTGTDRQVPLSNSYDAHFQLSFMCWNAETYAKTSTCCHGDMQKSQHYCHLVLILKAFLLTNMCGFTVGEPGVGLPLAACVNVHSQESIVTFVPNNYNVGHRGSVSLQDFLKSHCDEMCLM